MSYHDFLKAIIATGVAEVATLPICTTKTVYQNTASTSMLKTVRDIWKQNGIKGFYKASVPAIAGQMWSTGIKWYLYKKMESLDTGLPKVANGIISGGISTLGTQVFDSIKIHKQMSTVSGATFLDAVQKEGMGILWRGYSKTLSKTLIASAFFFPLNDYCKETSAKYIESKSLQSIIGSFCSSVISTTIMAPLDYLKTRHIYGHRNLYSGSFRSYYKGLGLNLMRIVPHFMCVMFIIDHL